MLQCCSGVVDVVGVGVKCCNAVVNVGGVGVVFTLTPRGSRAMDIFITTCLYTRLVITFIPLYVA